MRTRQALERLAKWRVLFAGWQLGTRSKGDPEADAVRDLQEARLMLRTEVTALTGLLLTKGVITEQELIRLWVTRQNSLAKIWRRGFLELGPQMTVWSLRKKQFLG